MHPRMTDMAMSVLLAALAACGGSGGASSSARAPAHSGEVWELDRPDDRASAPTALLAFVNGLDVMVVDGNDVYTGTTVRHAQPKGGARDVPLANGLDAQLIATGDTLQLRFPSGGQIPLRRRTVPMPSAR